MFEKLSADLVGSDLQYWRVRLGAFREVKFFQPQAFHEKIALGESGAIEMDLDSSIFTIKKETRSMFAQGALSGSVTPRNQLRLT